MKIDLTDVNAPRDQRELRVLSLAAMSMSRRPDAVAKARVLSSDTALAWLEMAERNRIGPIVAHVLLDATDRGSEVHTRAHRIHEASMARMRILMEELDAVAGHLATAGIRLVALKNAGIARALHPCPGCCPMGDIDVLVERERFLEAHARMADLGYRFDSRAIVEPAELEAALRSGGAEYVKQVAGHKVWLELQWRPIAGRWIRHHQEPDAATLIARSVPIPGTDARLLSADDNMLQVALHTAKHSYVRAPGLRLHTDVDRLVALAEPDWDVFLDAVDQLHVRTASYFSLALARALLQTPIPTGVLERTAPPGWKRHTIVRWLRQIDVFEPDERKFSRPAMMVFHALLYDGSRDLLASVLDAEPAALTDLGQLPRHVRRGVHRMRNLMTRYQA